MSVQALTDDVVIIIASGAKMVRNFARTFDATHVYWHAMGANIAPRKSVNFATSAKARRCLADTWWCPLDGLIQARKGLGYISAHISTTARAKLTTLEDIIAKGLGQMKKLRYV